MNNRADRFVAGVRARGSDARDVRDAAHEAYHATVAHLKRPWERERIHQALLKMSRIKKWGIAGLVHEEIDARAVEQMVCVHYGVDYDAEHWAMMAAMESCKTFGTNMPLDWWTNQISSRIDSQRLVKVATSLVMRMERKP